MPSDLVAEVLRGVEEGVVFMGAALRGLPVGRSHWRLPQSRAILGCGGAPTANTAYMGLTSHL